MNSVEHQGEAPAELISGVLSDAREYAMAEVDKLKAEAITQAKGVGEEVKVVSIALLLWTISAIMLGTSLSFILVAVGLPPWAAFGIIALVFAGLGALCIKQRKK